MYRQKLTLLCLCWTILCLDTCGAQSCVDVDCPVLQHCIEEVLNRGACCPTCVRRGCMCEGYQYYDCLSTGFQAGKVPEGKSYFVDFGSTECSCPRGGGKISCRFIPCPEIPANCIDVASPPDGCQQCKRVGCAHGNKKYEAGHSFQMDACQVCHCPNDGGRLMCSPVPGCHTQQRGAKRPASTTTTAATDDNHHHNNNNNPGRDVSRPLDNGRQPNPPPPPPPGPFSKLAFGNTLPLYKPDPPNAGTGDYDYNTLAAEPTSSTQHQDLPRASRFLEPTAVPPPPADHVTSSSASSSSSSGVHEDRRQELRERQGSHTQGRWRGAGDRRDRSDQTITNAAAAEEEETSSTPLTTTTTAAATTTSTQTLAQRGSTDEEHPRPPPQEAADRPVRRQPAELDRALQNSLKDISQAARGRHAGGGNHHHHHRQRDGQWGSSHAGRAAHGGGSSSSRSSSQGEKGSSAPMEGGGGRPGGGEDDDVVRGSSSSSSSSHPSVQFSPTRAPPVNKVGEEEEEERDQPRRQAQTLHNYQSSHREADTSEPSAKELLTACCDTGEKWASLNGHCNNMELPRADRRSICRTAQRQCCLGSLRETRCLTGVNAARQGTPCDEDGTDTCGADPAKECCRCCSLGLQYRAEGHGCEAHPRLDLQCRHAFLSCCQAEEEEEEGEEGTTAGGDGWRTVREKPSLDPTALPKKVSDSPFPKEAFSIGEEEEEQEEQERENAVVQIPPEVEDMDECLLYQGSLCHHRCINTVGSYRCQCFPGYSLQEDGLTCASESADEENRLREDDRVTVEPTALPPAPTTTPAVSPPDPCEENGPCVQQCTPVDGRPHCSCFPGFSQMADGQACADIDECLSSHTCQPNERCVNTEGSYACQRQIACPPGYQVYNDKCEDMDECAQRTDNCGLGFECVNTEGSFSCNPKPRCPAGFSQDVQGHCTDVDECASVSQPCSPGFTCINTAGSYRCQRRVLMCSRGYHASPDAARCIDVDECQGGLHRCGDGQLCHNLPGSYRCDCQTGYQYDSIRRTCVDVNECWRYAGRLCAQTCENSPGSYHCSCTAGFRLAADGKNCEDVNECLSSPCGQECANIYGSYQCYCRAGYYLREDGHTCEDIDECSQSVGHLCTYKCVNVPGSYQCTCPEYGYTMSPNGRSCRDIDECTSGGHNCSLAETCYNIQGGYRCLAFNCPQNYRKVSDTRCERISCPSYVECQNSPLRITYYYLSFQSNILIPAQIFRIGPSPAYSGDNVIISIAAGNEENYFSTRKLNAYTGAVYLNRQVHEPPRDFLIEVEMKLWRQGAFTTFQAKIYVFITANSL